MKGSGSPKLKKKQSVLETPNLHKDIHVLQGPT